MSVTILDILKRDDIQKDFKLLPFVLAPSAALSLMQELSEEGTFNRKEGIGISEAVAKADVSYIHGMEIYGITLNVIGCEDNE